MTYNEFKNKYIGKGIDFDGWYGYQCMDLAHQYAVDVVGFDFDPAPAAKDVWKQNPMGYEKIPNTPTGVPQQGDIIVWGDEVGPYGHIAVFDNGDVNKFQSLDQNWPVGSLTHIQDHNYKGVLGWFRPYDKIEGEKMTIDSATFEQLVTKSTKYDELLPRYEATEKLLHDNEETNKQKDVTINDLNNQIIEKDKRIHELEGELDAFIQRNEELATENENLRKKIVELEDEIEAMESTDEDEDSTDVPETPENPSTGTTEPQESPLVKLWNKIWEWLR